jgi:hypothetical protein
VKTSDRIEKPPQQKEPSLPKGGHIGHYAARVFHMNTGGHGNFIGWSIHIVYDSTDANQRIKKIIITCIRLAWEISNNR